MFDKKLIEETKEKSLELLEEIETPKGFVASSVNVDNYRRVFSRDGIIAGLASIKFKNKNLIETFKQTLLTLKRNQDHTGRIPSNVSLDEQKISYGTTVGRVDSSIWYVIGCCKYYFETNDQEFLDEVSDSIHKTIFYLECLELNGRGFLYIPPGGDWADEYINEGYVLFDQVLYLIALDHYYKVFREARIQDKKEHLKKIIKVNFFPKKKNIHDENVYQNKLFEKVLENYKSPVPIASFSAFGANYYYDLFGLALTFFCDFLSQEEKDEINQELVKTYDKELPVWPAFYPIINEKNPDWKKLNNNYIFRFKNKANEYHNGGLWPIAYGFYLSSKKIEKEEIMKFAEILKRDDYLFPEFYHGLTLEGLGTHRLGFSAAGYLLAYQKFVNGINIFEI